MICVCVYTYVHVYTEIGLNSKYKKPNTYRAYYSCESTAQGNGISEV